MGCAPILRGGRRSRSAGEQVSHGCLKKPRADWGLSLACNQGSRQKEKGVESDARETHNENTIPVYTWHSKQHEIPSWVSQIKSPDPQVSDHISDRLTHTSITLGCWYSSTPPPDDCISMHLTRPKQFRIQLKPIILAAAAAAAAAAARQPAAAAAGAAAAAAVAVVVAAAAAAAARLGQSLRGQCSGRGAPAAGAADAAAVAGVGSGCCLGRAAEREGQLQARQVVLDGLGGAVDYRKDGYADERGADVAVGLWQFAEEGVGVGPGGARGFGIRRKRSAFASLVGAFAPSQSSIIQPPTQPTHPLT
jgi:hypothetical protein